MKENFYPPVPHGLPQDPHSWRFLYGQWQGRVNRRGFWMYGVLAPIGLGLFLRALVDIAGVAAERSEPVVSLLLLGLGAMVSAKRWQDRGRSPWWVLLLLVPVVGTLWTVLDNGLVRGDRGQNRFGPVPASEPWDQIVSSDLRRR